MKRTIMISEDQANEMSFQYWDEGNDVKAYNGQLQISADGTKDISEPGKPLQADKLSHMETQQGFRTWRNLLGYPYHVGKGINSGIFEALENNNMQNAKGEENNDPNDPNNPKFAEVNKIPTSIQMYLDRLLSKLGELQLPPKKYANILNQVINAVNGYFKRIPFAIRKEWIEQLRNGVKNNNGQQTL